MNNLFDFVSSAELVPITIPIYNLETKNVVGEYTYKVSDLFSKRAELLFVSRLLKEGKRIYRPEYKGEHFSILADRTIYHFCLDSEEERVVYRASELSGEYEVVIIREKAEAGLSGIKGMSLYEAIE